MQPQESLSQQPSFIPEHGPVAEIRGVVLHFTSVSNIPWILTRGHGVLSIAQAKKVGEFIQSKHWVSVQDKNDRPEWISTYNSDDKNINWSAAFPYGTATVIAKKAKITLADTGEAQHQLLAETWVVDEIPISAIEGIVIDEQQLSISISKYLDEQISDDECELTFQRLQILSHHDLNLADKIRETSNKIFEEVNAEMKGAYWMLVADIIKQRRNKAMNAHYWKQIYPYDFNTHSIADFLMHLAEQAGCKLWIKRTISDEQSSITIAQIT